MQELKTTKTMDPLNVSLGQWVAEDFRTARVFEKYGMDFCCDGFMSLAAACRQKDLDPAALLEEVQAVQNEPGEKGPDFLAWELSALIDHIVTTHHAYLYENIEKVSAYAHEIARTHGLYHAELKKIATLIDTIAGSLVHHLGKEENAFFPLIKSVEAARKTGKIPDAKACETIRGFFPEIILEHKEVETALLSVRNLSQGYMIFGVVCSTHVVNYEKFKEFEADLKKHVHLENNILIPKVKQLLEQFL